MTKGTVTIDIEPCPTPEFCEAARKLCVGLIAAGAVGFRNGRLTLHFDNFGRVCVIERFTVQRLKTDHNADHDTKPREVEHQP